MSQAVKQETDDLLENEKSNADSKVKGEVDEKKVSPPTSPPISSEKMQRPNLKRTGSSLSRKRSHDEMAAAPETDKPSTIAAVEELSRTVPPSQSISMNADPSTKNMADTGAQAMPPPVLPKKSVTVPSQDMSPSQNSKAVQASNTAAQEASTNPNNISEKDASTDPAVEGRDLGSPGDAIDEFDWDDLRTRYHNRIDKLDAVERNILHDFDQLCDYFGIWANTGAAREVDRSFKRLKTQMTFVQHHENELEKKRLHYIKVVEAFKSALNLLGD